jgi:putative acetyltransferase
MIIRDEALADQPAIYELHTLAFHGPAEAKLVDNLRQSGDAVISLIATEGDRILGHILLSKLGSPMRALALAPIAVHPGFQRQGIGSVLIRNGLELSRQGGWEAVFILGDAGYYGRFGFSVEAAKGYISPYSGKHFMMLPLGLCTIPTTGRLVYPRHSRFWTNFSSDTLWKCCPRPSSYVSFAPSAGGSPALCPPRLE